MEEEDVGLFSSASYSIMGRKSRHQLTEDEKEARWLRRILANRESARQTIRRRQAMLVELTQKTAAMEMVNENLKRERELAASEYNLLKNTNERLKVQERELAASEYNLLKNTNERLKVQERELAASEYNLLKNTNERLKVQINDEMMKKEAMVMMKEKEKEKEKEKLELQNAESFDSASLTGPSVISNQSSSGPNWQSFPQASNGSIGILGSENGVATLMPMWMPNVEQMNSSMIAHPGAFVYVLPVPLLYPFPPAPINTHLVQTSDPNDSRPVHEFSYELANGEPSLAMKSKLRAACPSIFAGQEAGSIPSGDGDEDKDKDDNIGFKNYVKKPPFISFHEGDCSNSEDITSHHMTADFETEKSEGLRIVPSNRRFTDPIAAAEARKRRKELMKL